MHPIVVLGGSGFIGTAAMKRLSESHSTVTILDRSPPKKAARLKNVVWIEVDLAYDDIVLPEGSVIIMIGGSDIRHPHQWTHLRDSCVVLARLASQLHDRDVLLLSTIEVYGRTGGRLNDDSPIRLPASFKDMSAWCDELQAAAAMGNTDDLACEILDQMLRKDIGGRWTYGQAKYLQEIMLARIVDPRRLHILRLGNAYGQGQQRVLLQFVTRALLGEALEATDTSRSFVPVDQVAEAIHQMVCGVVPPGRYNLGGRCWALPDVAHYVLEELGSTVPVRVIPRPIEDIPREVDSSRLETMLTERDHETELRRFVRIENEQFAVMEPRVEVVIPSRPFNPDLVGARLRHCLQSGTLKYGNRWTSHLTERLSVELDLGPDHTLLLTNSGTSALRMAIVAIVGPARPGDVAVLPSFTFAATAEVLVQLGYRLRFCDVDPHGWTIDPLSLRSALQKGGCTVVVGVDALGNPIDYQAIKAVCAEFDVPFIADSAPALGAKYRGRPVGTQAAAHAFSMSFAKTVSAGGSGGAVVLPADRVDALTRGANWWRSSQMTEMAAVVALDQVEQLEVLVQRRSAVAETYAALDGLVVPQRPTVESRHAWVHWTARLPSGDRDTMGHALAKLGIETKPYYAPALHRLNWGSGTEPQVQLPVTEEICAGALALPMSSELNIAQAEQITLTLIRLMPKIAKPDSCRRFSRA